MEDVDLLIKNTRVYTMTPAHTVFAKGAIAITGTEIVAVGASDDIESRYSSQQTIDGSRCMAMPGLVDVHLHPFLNIHMPREESADEGFAYAGPSAGRSDWLIHDPSVPPMAFSLAAHQPGWPNVQELFGQLAMQDMIPPVVSYLLSMQTLLLSVRGGTTTFIEGGSGQPDSVADAAREIGIRAGVAHTVSDLGFTEGGEPPRVKDTEKELLDAEAFAQRWDGCDDGMVSGWLSLFAEPGASDELLTGLARLSRERQLPLGGHSAATYSFEDYSKAIFGKPGLTRLADLGCLDTHYLAGHMGFYDDEELDRVAAKNLYIAHCPGTACHAGKSIIRDKKIIKAMQSGIVAGLGVDSIHHGSLVDEMRRAYTGHKDAWGDDRMLPAYKVLEMATCDGAQAAHLGGKVGQLAPGLKADLILIDIDKPEYDNREPIDAFMRTGASRDVRTSIINGRIVMRDREILSVDEAAVRREFRGANLLIAKMMSGELGGDAKAF
ncbi:MAG: amidohydrolase family protein [Pseudomonadota bacterium]